MSGQSDLVLDKLPFDSVDRPESNEGHFLRTDDRLIESSDVRHAEFIRQSDNLNMLQCLEDNDLLSAVSESRQGDMDVSLFSLCQDTCHFTIESDLGLVGKEVAEGEGHVAENRKFSPDAGIQPSARNQSPIQNDFRFADISSDLDLNCRKDDDQFVNDNRLKNVHVRADLASDANATLLSQHVMENCAMREEGSHENVAFSSSESNDNRVDILDRLQAARSDANLQSPAHNVLEQSSNSQLRLDSQSNLISEPDRNSNPILLSIAIHSPSSPNDTNVKSVPSTDTASLPHASVPDELDLDDDLIAELENECGGGADATAAHLSPLQKSYAALEIRLRHSMEARKQLELVVVELEWRLEATTNARVLATKETEEKVDRLEAELSELKDMLVMQEEVTKQANLDLQAEHQTKLDAVNRACEEVQRDKDAAVMRYAQAEQRSIEAQERSGKAEARLRDWAKERDVALGKWQKMKEDKKAALDLCDKKTGELATMKKELDAQKELVSSTDIKVKWNQNKLKTEQDAHKETKTKLDDFERKLMEVRGEAYVVLEQLRNMFKIFQDLDVNSTRPAETQQKKDTATSLDEMMLVIKKDAGTLTWKQRELVEELRTFRDKVRCLEVERRSQEDALNSCRSSLDGQRQGNIDLRDRTLQLEKAEAQLIEQEMRLQSSTRRTEELELIYRDQRSELDQSNQRENERLAFTQRISDRLSALQAENSLLQTQKSSLTEKLDEAMLQNKLLEERNRRLDEELLKVNTEMGEEREQLSRQLASQQQLAERTQTKFNDAEDEIKVLKRKYASIAKDMSRQLTLANKRSDGREQRSTLSGGDKDSASLGSRGSCGSLDAVGLPGGPYSHELSPHEEDESLRSAAGVLSADDASGGGGAGVGGGHEACVERLARLERAVGRGKDKLDFLQDHVEQLQEEINRKAAIIRSYVLREEAGTLAPEASDRVKAQLSRKGGIMASVYSSHHLDEGMTIGLSLEINRKLQALLEDTLLKNIKLKEGMDTLGAEIDWLSHENKQLLQQIMSTGGATITQRSTLTQLNGERHS